ncbi:hypothetical protein [Bradyrhizobium sp.]|uniref:hypothetical protein n=1 Tax=Bradyrhizobium sp. TaxID=376 RepID=UPI003C6F06F7
MSEAVNRFDAAVCDGSEVAFLADLLAAARLVFAAAFARTGRRGAALEELLRDFVDIRLPFVAFGGSIIRLLRSCPANRNRPGGCASLVAPEYGYKEFDAPPVPSLKEFIRAR